MNAFYKKSKNKINFKFINKYYNDINKKIWIKKLTIQQFFRLQTTMLNKFFHRGQIISKGFSVGVPKTPIEMDTPLKGGRYPNYSPASDLVGNHCDTFLTIWSFF
jgi:hypothetical protein